MKEKILSGILVALALTALSVNLTACSADTQAVEYNAETSGNYESGILDVKFTPADTADGFVYVRCNPEALNDEIHRYVVSLQNADKPDSKTGSGLYYQFTLNYWDLLHDAMEKYKQDSVLADAVTVKLPRRINSIAPTDDEICDFLVAIAPYRKGIIKQCEKDVSAKYADVVGYINYIASCAAPTVDERWKFEIVRDFLNGENDALSYLDTKDK